MCAGGGISSGRGYVHVVKFRGDYIHVVKFIEGGNYVYLYKNEQGGFCPGGYWSYPILTL